MQSVTWYVKRIKMMSVSEIIWRVTSLINAWVERFRVQFDLVPSARFDRDFDEKADFKGGFSVFDGNITSYSDLWREPLISKADLILENKLSYFDLKECDLETPINWHKDHSANIVASLDHILAVNYRDFPNNGDCKLVWEPNRHHQFVVLARAYKVSGELKYAQGVVDQLTSWLDANPYGRGMNWRSPLELAIRLINWVWAIDLIKSSGLFVGEFKQRVLESVYLHCRDVSGKFSQGTSANNHLVGEAAGVYIAACYFDMLDDAKMWQEKSKLVLETEIQAQTFLDGCTKEHAFSYQFFVYQFYLFTALTGKLKRDNFSAEYWSTLNSLSLFIAKVAQGGGEYPMLGDQDDGYVLDLGDHVHNINALCDVMGYFFNDPIYNSLSMEKSETSFWLFDERMDKMSCEGLADVPLASMDFSDSGYYLLQGGKIEDRNQASVLFDCAELGYTAIAAHGHADALSLVVRINQLDLFVDTGTFDYFSYPQWRNHFRSTKAHNTVEVDGVDQSVMTGPFMWEQHAKTTLINWSPSETGGKISASHSGYQRLVQPVQHQRSVLLDTQERLLEVIDTINTDGEHDIAIYFHLSEYCHELEVLEHGCRLKLGDDFIVLSFSKELSISIIQGQGESLPVEPCVGWLSRGYHQQVAISTICLKARVAHNTEFKTQISW